MAIRRVFKVSAKDRLGTKVRIQGEVIADSGTLTKDEVARIQRGIALTLGDVLRKTPLTHFDFDNIKMKV